MSPLMHSSKHSILRMVKFIANYTLLIFEANSGFLEDISGVIDKYGAAAKLLLGAG